MKKASVMKTTGFTWLLAALFGAISIGVSAEDATPDATSEPPGSSVPGEAGLWIYVDPETGELTTERPADFDTVVPLRAKALPNALSRSTEKLEVFELPDGGRGLFLAGRFQSATLAKKRGDGSFEVRCVHDHDHAEAFFHGPERAASSARTAEEK